MLEMIESKFLERKKTYKFTETSFLANARAI